MWPWGPTSSLSTWRGRGGGRAVAAAAPAPAAGRRCRPAAAPPPPPKPAAAPLPRLLLPLAAATEEVRERRVKMTRMRQRIAVRLKEAQNLTAMLTTFNEVDMSGLTNMRNEYKVCACARPAGRPHLLWPVRERDARHL